MRLLACSCVTLLTCLITVTTGDREDLDKKVPYFTTTFFYCESQAVNTSLLNSRINSVSWLLPDNTLLTPGQMWKKAIVSVDGYNLTISNINDDVFGYYHCIIVMKPVMGKPAEVKSIQFGLNINGADFSDLREQFRKSAIIGAISAAVMVVVFGLSCLIWHYRYSAKHTGESCSVEVKHESHIQAYENAVYEVDAETKDVLDDVKVSPSDDILNDEPVVVESVNFHTEKL